jgi:glycosyltransferase involved in cell wall biosynthesis
MTEPRPFFSIVMPVYNHANLVRRAIESCLQQSFADFEIVAVDDGSTDDSAAVIASIADPRIRLVRQEKNRGVCPARNLGMSEARGAWFVFFDSDDELLPGALEAIHGRAIAAGPEVGGLRFMVRDEQGLTVDPPHDDTVWDYEAYLRWFELAIDRRYEALPCMRGDLYPSVSYPDDRSSEMLFHLDLFRRTNVLACREVVRQYHHHPGERITAPRFSKVRIIAIDVAANAGIILARHGEDIRRIAPTVYAEFLRGALMASLLSGQRRLALHYANLRLRMHPFALRTWIILSVGLIASPLLLIFQWTNREFRRRAIWLFHTR